MKKMKYSCLLFVGTIRAHLQVLCTTSIRTFQSFKAVNFKGGSQMEKEEVSLFHVRF